LGETTQNRRDTENTQRKKREREREKRKNDTLRTKKQVCFLYKLALSLMFHFMSCMCIHLIKNKKESRHASCTQTTTPVVAAALLHVYHALPQPPSHHVTYPEPREPLHVFQHLTNLALHDTMAP